VSPSGLATASGDPLLEGFYPGQLNPTGAAGSLTVNTGRLTVRDGGSVNVQSLESGNAGIIKVVADAIALDNQGSIDASTGSGTGGNITLHARDILLRRGSRISTDAGDTQGGNITINTDTLVAVPMEDSDITANAKKGPGGRVSITAQGIFGTQFRKGDTPESDITASSDEGPQFNGTVQIDIQGINPSRGLVELPETFVDSSQLIVTGCPVDQGNSFVITGRGGLPEDPTQTLRGRTVWQDLRLAGGTTGTGEQARISQSQSLEQNQQLRTKNQQPASLVEATGWMINAEGQVELVAYTPKVTPQSSWYTLANCGDLK
jgi:large exoprotein involved in heme utilization and adhesion